MAGTDVAEPKVVEGEVLPPGGDGTGLEGMSDRQVAMAFARAADSQAVALTSPTHLIVQGLLILPAVLLGVLMLDIHILGPVFEPLGQAIMPQSWDATIASSMPFGGELFGDKTWNSTFAIVGALGLFALSRFTLLGKNFLTVAGPAVYFVLLAAGAYAGWEFVETTIPQAQDQLGPLAAALLPIGSFMGMAALGMTHKVFSSAYNGIMLLGAHLGDKGAALTFMARTGQDEGTSISAAVDDFVKAAVFAIFGNRIARHMAISSSLLPDAKPA